MERGGLTPRILSICTSWGTAVISCSGHCTRAKKYRTDVWCAGWVIAAIGTVRGKLLVAVCGQGERVALLTVC